jgi:hypothetical protein
MASGPGSKRRGQMPTSRQKNGRSGKENLAIQENDLKDLLKLLVVNLVSGLALPDHGTIRLENLMNDLFDEINIAFEDDDDTIESGGEL